MKNIIFILAILLGLSINVSAQSFLQFVEDVNSATGITANDYTSNLKKTEMLGFPNQTLWSLYVSGVRVLAHSEPTIDIKTQKEVITPVVNEMIVDSLKMANNTLVQEIQTKNIQITELESKMVVANTIIEDLQIQLYEQKKLHNTHQKGDVLVVSKGYKSIRNIRTGKTVSANEFDRLYDLGYIQHLKNRMWVYNPAVESTAKRE